MELISSIRENLINFDKSSQYNKIFIDYGVKIKENVFDTKIKYLNNTKNNLFDLIPMINSLFYNYLVDFELLNIQNINIEDRTLVNIYNNRTNSKNRIYYHNSLKDYQILDIKDLFDYNILVKYKKNTRISLNKFNNGRIFHNLETFNSLRWILLDDVYINIKFNNNYFGVSLELDLGKNQISNQKMKNLTNILEKYNILLNYLNTVKNFKK